MEGDGARTHPVPAKPRSQVLRAGIRIVAEQFAPYSDEPDELSELESLRSIYIQMGRAYGKQMQLYAEAFKGWSEHLQFFPDKLDLSPSAPKDHRKRTKRPREEEPYYVKLTKQKRR